MPSSRISREKTEHIIGNKVDISVDAEDSDEEDAATDSGISRAVSGQHESSSSPQQIRKMREALSMQAKSYMELEQLVAALNALGMWRLVVDEKMQSVVFPR